MKIKVPFIEMKDPLDCGPIALQMTLSYFNDKTYLDKLRELVGAEEGKGVWTIDLAVAARKLGYDIKYFSKIIGTAPENLEMDYYKRYASGDSEEMEMKNKNAKEIGVDVEIKSFRLEELLTFLDKEHMMIVLLDWNIVRNLEEKGYQGHFVPVVGYDKEKVYVHNPGMKDPMPSYPISREVFDKARKAKGTDEDFILISKQNKISSPKNL